MFVDFILFLFLRFIVLFSRGQEGNPNPVIGRAIQNISVEFLFLVFLTIFAELPHTTLSLSVRRILGGGVPAGLVSGRHTQPGSTRTPSPARGSGTWRSRLDRGAKALLPLGADTGNVGHGRCGSFPASGLD